MRDVVLPACAVLFLLAALYTVTVRREVYAEARRIGALEERLREQRRRNENAEILRERLASPGALLERARQAGLVDEGEALGRPTTQGRKEALGHATTQGRVAGGPGAR